MQNSQVSSRGSKPGGLYIRFADFTHAGYYECVARTPLNQDSKRALLTVIGKWKKMNRHLTLTIDFKLKQGIRKKLSVIDALVNTNV